MLIEIKIKPSGIVGNARIVRSDLGDQVFEKSVIDRILAWKFQTVPDSVGDLDINYPFEFHEEE